MKKKLTEIIVQAIKRKQLINKKWDKLEQSVFESNVCFLHQKSASKELDKQKSTRGKNDKLNKHEMKSNKRTI